MKVLQEISEDQNEGLMALIGQTITVFCGVYIYTGKLVGVNKEDIKLENPGIVYETGELTSKQWKDMQRLPNKEWYVRTTAIESYGVLK